MPQAVLASESVSLAPVGLVACILIMNGMPVPFFVKVLGYASGSELSEDAVERVAVLTYKLIPQSPEKRNLFGGKEFAIEGVSLCHFDTPIAATDSFNRVRTHEYQNILPNRFFRN